MYSFSLSINFFSLSLSLPFPLLEIVDRLSMNWDQTHRQTDRQTDRQAEARREREREKEKMHFSDEQHEQQEQQVVHTQINSKQIDDIPGISFYKILGTYSPSPSLPSFLLSPSSPLSLILKAVMIDIRKSDYYS